MLSKVIKMVLYGLSRWKILTAYAVFSTLCLSGWYVDLAGLFSRQDDFAALFKASHGDLGVYNFLAFLVGTLFFLLFMLYDYMKRRLDKIQVGSSTNKASSVFGNTTQTITENSTNSPVVTGPGTIINYSTTGITEERCRAIFDEKWAIAIRELTFESVETAEERRRDFQTQLITRLGKNTDGFTAFADPAFQFLLIDAQKAAAATDREADYTLLSELLAQRAKVGNDRRMQIYIKKAIEVLPYIPDEALLGLTVSFMILNVIPIVGDIKKGLSVLNETYGHVIGEESLPVDSKWVDTLYACGLVNVSLGGVLSLNNALTILADKMAGYSLPGIRKNSEDYNKAISILSEVGLPPTALVEHELNPEYVRLGIVEESQIDSLKNIKELPHGIKVTIYTNEEQKAALHNIYALYDKGEAFVSDFEKKFEIEMQQYPYLKMIMEWWNQIPVAYQLTMTGQTLASANANKCDSQIPLLEQ